MVAGGADVSVFNDDISIPERICTSVLFAGGHVCTISIVATVAGWNSLPRGVL